MTEILLAVMVLGILGWWLSRRRRSPRRLGTAPHLGRSRAGAAAASPQLMRRLDRLTKDRRVSERLIERVEFNHPGRSRSWCIEKAIYDIQRDRRS